MLSHSVPFISQICLGGISTLPIRLLLDGLHPIFNLVHACSFGVDRNLRWRLHVLFHVLVVEVLFAEGAGVEVAATRIIQILLQRQTLLQLIERVVCSVSG